MYIVQFVYALVAKQHMFLCLTFKKVFTIETILKSNSKIHTFIRLPTRTHLQQQEEKKIMNMI